MRVFDPKSGRTHTFDHAEQILCRLADGTLDLAAIHAGQGPLGGDMPEEDVTRFFRRLHVLGLLKPGKAPETPDPSATEGDNTDTRDLVARRRKEQAGDGGLMARRRLGKGPFAAASAGPHGKVPGGMRERLARRAAPPAGMRGPLAERRGAGRGRGTGTQAARQHSAGQAPR